MAEERREEVKEVVPSSQVALTDFVFTCSSCGLREKAYFRLNETNLPRSVAKCVNIKEKRAVLTFDPFTSREKGKTKLLLLGGECSCCGVEVCVDCSFYYRNRLCLTCAKQSSKELPAEVQLRLRRRLERQLQSA